MEISDFQKLAIQKIARKFTIAFLVAFGSQITKQMHPESDFDVAYFSRQPLNQEQEFILGQKLSEIFPKLKIDLVDLRQATPLLKKKILFDGKLLVEIIPHSFAFAQINSAQEYFDTKPLRDLALAY